MIEGLMPFFTTCGAMWGERRAASRSDIDELSAIAI
jgi:hypothetical protein